MTKFESSPVVKMIDNKNKVLEMLECALGNCDNIKSLGEAGIEIVKSQIQDAIDILETGTKQ